MWDFRWNSCRNILVTVLLQEAERCVRLFLQCAQDENAVSKWKSSARIKEPKPKAHAELYIPDEWKPKSQVLKEENLPVFKLVYDLILRLVHEVRKMDKRFQILNRAGSEIEFDEGRDIYLSCK